MSAVSLHVTETVLAFTMMVIMAYFLKKKRGAQTGRQRPFRETAHSGDITRDNFLSTLDKPSLRRKSGSRSGHVLNGNRFSGNQLADRGPLEIRSPKYRRADDCLILRVFRAYRISHHSVRLC